ncbi:MAG TPA: GTPase, partial [Tissierellaceae bacterium]|nr:GTPase [Tissierellaceae bacterium]
FLITDTVGFVSKLPTHLIEAFKGTLEEVRYADLILHVVDASNEDLDIQISTTLDILNSLEVLDKPIITVFNKMDLVELKELVYDNYSIDEKIFISAKDTSDLNRLLELIEEKLPQKFKKVWIQIPYDKQQLLNYLMNNYEVEDISHQVEGSLVNLSINSMDLERFKEFVIDRS